MNRRPASNLLGHYAGFISRVFAFVIDLALVTVAVLAITWMLAGLVAALRLQIVLDNLSNIFPGLGQVIYGLAGLLSIGVLTALVYFLYQVFFWVLTGSTLGKALMGLRVVRINGERIHPLRAIARYIGYIISIIPLGLGFLWILFDDRRQGWHDKLAGTCVIYTWAARPDERFLAEEIRQAEDIVPPLGLDENQVIEANLAHRADQ